MKTEAEKNSAAVALARLRAGVKERPSARKRAAVLANLEKARAVRWVKPEQGEALTQFEFEALSNEEQLDLAEKHGRVFYELRIDGKPYFSLYPSRESAIKGGQMVRKNGAREVVKIIVYHGRRFMGF